MTFMAGLSTDDSEPSVKYETDEWAEFMRNLDLLREKAKQEQEKALPIEPGREPGGKGEGQKASNSVGNAEASEGAGQTGTDGNMADGVGSKGNRQPEVIERGPASGNQLADMQDGNGFQEDGIALLGNPEIEHVVGRDGGTNSDGRERKGD